MSDTLAIKGTLGESVFFSLPVNTAARVAYRIAGPHRLSGLVFSGRAGGAAAANAGQSRVIVLVGDIGADTIDLSNGAGAGINLETPQGLTGRRIFDGMAGIGSTAGVQTIGLGWNVQNGEVVTVIVGQVIRDSDGSSNIVAVIGLTLLGDRDDQLAAR